MFILNKYTIILCVLINIVVGLFEKECENDPFKDYVSHPNYCRRYIYCTGTEGLEGECPNGDYFDEITGTCDRPENVDCVDKPINEITTTEKPIILTTQSTSTSTSTISSTSSTSTTSTTTTSTSTSTTSNQPIETCPPEDDPNQIVYIKSPTSQSEYFICYHGSPMLMTCTDKLYFNLTTKTCELIENNNNGNNPSTPSTADCTENKNVFYPHPTQCEFFYYCLNGHMTLQQCPLFYQWDVIKQSCHLPNEAQCFIQNLIK